MRTNTRQRIASAVVLIVAVLVCVFSGKIPSLALIFLFGVCSIHELECNFFGCSPTSPDYICSQLFFVLCFIYFGFWGLGENALIFIPLGITQSCLLLYYLFATRMESRKMVQFFVRIPALAGIFVTIPFMSALSLLRYPTWVECFLLLSVVNFGMDIGAWFWGQRLGKRPLYPSVSPNKTVEGFVGGVLSTLLLAGVGLYVLTGTLGLRELLIILILPGLSQLGDLSQSKLKRQIGIKDSSALIPGHGGVYDRIDSIMFTAPFMASLQAWL